MNTTDLQRKVTQAYGRGSLVLKKYSPEILLGAGLLGAVIAAVMAAKATLDVEPIIEEHKNAIDTIDRLAEENTQEAVIRAKTTAYTGTVLKFGKLYGPALGLGVLSVSAILASHGIMGRRQVSLIAAYNLLNEGFQSYRNRVVEELGVGKDLEYKLGLVETTTKIKETDPETGEVTKTKVHGYDKHPNAFSIYSRFFDESNPQYARDSRALNMAFLLSQQSYINDVLTIRGHVFLNEVYERLGFPHTKEGAIVGWILKDLKEMKEEKRDGHIDFGIVNIESRPAREFVNQMNPTILLDFNVDGIIYNLI